MLFFRLLQLRRRWRRANDERALSLSIYHDCRMNGVLALADTYYEDAQRAEAKQDRAAVAMLSLGGEPHMTTGELWSVCWRRAPRWLQSLLISLAILAVLVVGSINLP